MYLTRYPLQKKHHLTEIPENFQTPAATGADTPPPLQPGHVAHPQGYHQVEFNLDLRNDAAQPNFIAFGHEPASPITPPPP